MKKNIFAKLIAFVLVMFISFFGILPTLEAERCSVVYAGDATVTPQNPTSEKAGLLEHALTLVVLLLGAALYFLIGVAAGTPLTVETIIFNKYSNISLNIFQRNGQWKSFYREWS